MWKSHYLVTCIKLENRVGRRIENETACVPMEFKNRVTPTLSRLDIFAYWCYLDKNFNKNLRMDNCCKRAWLPVLSMIMILFNIPGSASAQFEQKLSLNISGGYFNTVGWDGWEENWEDLHGPSLMPNFKGGPSLIAGLQYNFNRHFSLEFQLGYRLSFTWYFDDSEEGDDPHNYLSWEINDESGIEVLESGENYMDLSNLHLGLAPRYYLFPGNRFNPFIYAGISLNYTDVWFENTEYEAYGSLGREDDYQEKYELENWFDYHVGIGLMAGAGVEYSLRETLGLFAIAGYYFIPLKEEAFATNTYLVNYHDININLGVRISILKSKEL